MQKPISLHKLPILPEHWVGRADVRPLTGVSMYAHRSKATTEEWGIALLEVDGHYVTYRFLKCTMHSYGG